MLFAIALMLCAALPAVARPLSEDETKALTRSMDSYLRAIGSGDATRIVEGIPPRIVNIFAGTSGVEAHSLKKTLVDQTAAMLKGAKFSDVGADATAINAQDAAMADGTTVTWAVVPTSFTATTKTAKTRNEQPMLAIREDKTWYFVRIDGEQQKQMVSIAYPFLASVQFPEARVSQMP